jgi:3-dehydroquinate synthase
MNRSAAPPLKLSVDLDQRAYDIVIGEGLLETAGSLLSPLLVQSRVITVTDETVAPLYLSSLEASLDVAGITHDAIVLPAGEQTKDFSHLQNLINRLLELRVERNTTLIALGGGVIGDITGFAAAIVLRGIDFVQIPTTLLAQVDSAVGGKTGINTTFGKNLVGAFHQPRLVLSDTKTLDTLDQRQLRAGYAEVVKYGLIGDAAFFSWLETNSDALLKGDSAARRHAIMTSCAAKASIVAKDEKERTTRALLNLGHTFGHALEAQTGYGGTLLHGEAVAIGMVMAFDLSAQTGLCGEQDAARVRQLVDNAGLPSGLSGLADHTWTADALINLISQDKKVVDGAATFVLARGIGQAFISSEVSPEHVSSLLSKAITAATG